LKKHKGIPYVVLYLGGRRPRVVMVRAGTDLRIKMCAEQKQRDMRRISIVLESKKVHYNKEDRRSNSRRGFIHQRTPARS
jgi:hypothetical protein